MLPEEGGEFLPSGGEASYACYAQCSHRRRRLLARAPVALPVTRHVRFPTMRNGRDATGECCPPAVRAPLGRMKGAPAASIDMPAFVRRGLDVGWRFTDAHVLH